MNGNKSKNKKNKNIKSDNIAKYYNIYLLFQDWHMKIWASNFLCHFAWMLLIGIYFLGCIRNDWGTNIACILIVIWAIVLGFKLIKFSFSLECFDIRDGVFDKYIKMMREGFNRYGLIPDGDNYIMMETGDLVEKLLVELDNSISRGAQLESPYMLITDMFIVSRSALSLQYCPVAVPKDMINEISFFDKGIVYKRRLAIYEFMNIKVKQQEDNSEPTVLTRVVAKKGIFGRKKTIRDYKVEPFDGIKIVESVEHNGAIEVV